MTKQLCELGDFLSAGNTVVNNHKSLTSWNLYSNGGRDRQFKKKKSKLSTIEKNNKVSRLWRKIKQECGRKLKLVWTWEHVLGL